MLKETATLWTIHQFMFRALTAFEEEFSVID